MRHSLLPAAFVAAALTLSAAAGPVEGPKTSQIKIEAGRKGAGGELIPGRALFQVEYRGGERACVMAVGDHKPPVPMAIIVYDDKKNKVAEDYGSEEAPDYVAAFWYPPRDGRYTIEVRSAGVEYNAVFLSVR